MQHTSSVTRKASWRRWTKYRKAFAAQRRKARDASDLNKTIVKMIRAGGPELRDSWGNNLHIEPVPWDAQKKYYLVHSAGPDKQFDTGDDLGIYLQVYRRKVVGHRALGRARLRRTLSMAAGL